MRPLRVALVALVVMLLGVSVATPQTNIALSALGIDLWPEYDRAGVLVIYRATIAPGVSLPTRLVFRIPAAAGLPSAVAERSPDGQLITVPYDRAVAGEIALIELTASLPFVQVEYYDPAITRDGARRRFAFAWSGNLEIQDFSISLQQPHLAQNFTTVPPTTSTTTSVDGLTHYVLSRGAVKAGEVVEMQASYEKASDQLSVETLPPPALPASAAPSAPGLAPVAAPAPAAAAVSDSRTGSVILAVLVVSVATFLALLMIRSRQRAGTVPQSIPAPRSARSGSPEKKATQFCTQCGAGIAGEDRFCRLCGAAVKT